MACRKTLNRGMDGPSPHVSLFYVRNRRKYLFAVYFLKCNLYWQSLGQKVGFVTVVDIFSEEVTLVDKGEWCLLMYNLTFGCITLPFFYTRIHSPCIWKIWNRGISDTVRHLHVLLHVCKLLSHTADRTASDACV